ncbi:hypothetical protein LTR91_003309 [Friedmanniomyces endolithicus]|uniref:Thioredoxin domain-containing protein n=1 Tax=Friedmanniomyces endolithicus TaxID=329885 RepID=A0AAN6KZQ8_9PEZI|nr:hypothetical protein LTR94_002618 [Friedmanniomyces endolithicus]KAK0810580.1 hypothetical protein LTR75_005565 [Friedmanniomyces endolithicus]KAK0812488.1 hypothetical protein LTR59_001449 [Friedmanniomyces endolithicus]KAK0812644.1 hypothetical protein LTR38_003260 [Friedmanniomyces endolithicus]KAK0843020.1 hypothetical protein LTR03_008954 [Friedmanniomyces endolithicus]
METLTDRNSYVKATNEDGFCILEATAYDTDTADDISQELGASQMPTFHAFKDGDLMGSVTGAKAAQLEALIKENYGGKVVEG